MVLAARLALASATSAFAVSDTMLAEGGKRYAYHPVSWTPKY